MHYIINDVICFDPLGKTLYLRSEPEIHIVLSVPASRLLLEFLQQCDLDISRESLLERVWAEHGFKPSMHNLYKSVSELRKAFIALGYDQKLIETLQGIGFRFSADIQQHMQEAQNASGPEPLLNSHSNVAPPFVEASAREVVHITSNKLKQSTNRWRIAIAVGVLLLAFIGLRVGWMIYMADNANLQPRMIGKCQINLLNAGSDLQLAQSVANQIGCRDQAKRVFYDSTEIIGNQDTKLLEFTAVCRRQGEKESCDNEINVK